LLKISEMIVRGANLPVRDPNIVQAGFEFDAESAPMS